MGNAQQQVSSTDPPLCSVSDIDLLRFSGRWFEVARLPNWFQVTSGPRHLISVDYTAHLDEADSRRVVSLDVHNRDQDLDTKHVVEVAGTARPSNPPRGELAVRLSPSLSVPLVSPFEKPYWVIDLDEDTYAWAVVSEPTRRYLWVLSRQLPMDAHVLSEILLRLRTEHGFSAGTLEALMFARLQ